MHFNGPYKTAELIDVLEGKPKKSVLLEASIAIVGNSYVIIHYEGGDKKVPHMKRTLILDSNAFRGFEGKGYADSGDRF